MAGPDPTACTDLRSDRENRVISRHWSSSRARSQKINPLITLLLYPRGQNILEMCARGRVRPGHDKGIDMLRRYVLQGGFTHPLCRDPPWPRIWPIRGLCRLPELTRDR